MSKKRIARQKAEHKMFGKLTAAYKKETQAGLNSLKTDFATP